MTQRLYHKGTILTVSFFPAHKYYWSDFHRDVTLGPAQALTPSKALRAHTIDAAWQDFRDTERGSIEADKRADVAILSENPLTAERRSIEVEETILRGATVYLRQTSGSKP